MLVVIAEASNPVLTPTICAAPRVIGRQVIPLGAAEAVILADGAPLPPVSLAALSLTRRCPSVDAFAVALGDRVFGTCACLVQDLGGASVTAGLVPLGEEDVSSASDIVGDRNVGNWTRSLEKTRSRIQSSATRTFFAKPGSLLR